MSDGVKKKDYWNSAELSWWEKPYLFEICRGLWVTFSVFCGNMLKWLTFRKGALTVYYPEEMRADYATAFRGRHKLLKTEKGRPRCIACMMCANICPAKVITIEGGSSPDPEDAYSRKVPVRFEIDWSRCIFCGFCVETCPRKAIEMDSSVQDLPRYDRKELVINLPALLSWHEEKKP